MFGCVVVVWVCVYMCVGKWIVWMCGCVHVWIYVSVCVCGCVGVCG